MASNTSTHENSASDVAVESNTASGIVSHSTTSKATTQITEEQAENLITDYLKSKGLSKEADKNLIISLDHTDAADGHEYYVFHVYDNMEDHTATLGWYGVQKDDGSFCDFLLMKPVS